MHPILIKIGPLTIHTYGVFLASGFLLGLALAIRQAKKQGISPDTIINLCFYILLGAIVGSRLLFIIMNIGSYMRQPLSIFKIWEGGLIYYGGAALAIAFAIFYLKKVRLDFLTAADILAPSIAIGYAIGRLGCLSAGCCYGRPSQGLPWGITFVDPHSLAPTGVELHPTQLYSSIGSFIIFLILILFRKHQSFKGQLILSYAMLYSVLRFLVEFYRDAGSKDALWAGLSVSQGISAMLFIAAVVTYFLVKKKAKKEKT